MNNNPRQDFITEHGAAAYFRLLRIALMLRDVGIDINKLDKKSLSIVVLMLP